MKSLSKTNIQFFERLEFSIYPGVIVVSALLCGRLYPLLPEVLLALLPLPLVLRTREVLSKIGDLGQFEKASIGLYLIYLGFCTALIPISIYGGSISSALVGFLYLTVIPLAFCSAILSRIDIDLLFKFLCFFIALLPIIIGFDFFFSPTRSMGLSRSVLFFSHVMALVIIFLGSVFLLRNKLNNVFLMIGFLLVLFMLTKTRIILVELFVFSFFVGVYIKKTRLLFVISLCLIFFLLLEDESSYLVKRVISILDFDEGPNAHRISQYLRGIYEVQSNPFGFGFGRVSGPLSQLVPTDIGMPESTLLSFWISSGYFTVLLVLVFIVCAWKSPIAFMFFLTFSPALLITGFGMNPVVLFGFCFGFFYLVFLQGYSDGGT